MSRVDASSSDLEKSRIHDSSGWYLAVILRRVSEREVSHLAHLPLSIAATFRFDIFKEMAHDAPSRIHADRAAGGDPHHRRPDPPAPARRPGAPRGRPPLPVRQQLEAD